MIRLRPVFMAYCSVLHLRSINTSCFIDRIRKVTLLSATCVFVLQESQISNNCHITIGSLNGRPGKFLFVKFFNEIVLY